MATSIKKTKPVTATSKQTLTPNQAVLASMQVVRPAATRAQQQDTPVLATIHKARVQYKAAAYKGNVNFTFDLADGRTGLKLEYPAGTDKADALLARITEPGLEVYVIEGTNGQFYLADTNFGVPQPTVLDRVIDNCTTMVVAYNSILAAHPGIPEQVAASLAATAAIPVLKR